MASLSPVGRELEFLWDLHNITYSAGDKASTLALIGALSTMPATPPLPAFRPPVPRLPALPTAEAPGQLSAVMTAVPRSTYRMVRFGSVERPDYSSYAPIGTDDRYHVSLSIGNYTPRPAIRVLRLRELIPGDAIRKQMQASIDLEKVTRIDVWIDETPVPVLFSEPVSGAAEVAVPLSNGHTLRVSHYARMGSITLSLGGQSVSVRSI